MTRGSRLFLSLSLAGVVLVAAFLLLALPGRSGLEKRSGCVLAEASDLRFGDQEGAVEDISMPRAQDPGVEEVFPERGQDPSVAFYASRIREAMREAHPSSVLLDEVEIVVEGFSLEENR